MKYIIHYDTNSDEGRTYALAATNKADYIIKVLNKLGKDVEIISASLTSNKGYKKGSKISINNKTTLIKLPAFKWGNKIQKIVAYLWSNIALCSYLIFKTKKNEEVMKQIKQYEDAATSNGDVTKGLKEQLDDTRLLIGSVDVVGEGITLTLTPKSNIFSTNLTAQYLRDEELIYIVNELSYSGAEAIAINDKRVTLQTGIKSSSGNSQILINDERISPRDKIVIKAIGNKENLIQGLNFPGALDFQALQYYDKKIEESSKLEIPKFGKSYKFEYMKPVK